MPADPELFTPGGISAPGYRGAPQTKQWMEDRGPVQEGSGNQRPPRGPIVNNPKIPLLTKAVTGTVLLGMLYGKDYWLRPTLKASVKPKSGFWDWLTWTVASIQKFLNPRVHKVTHDIGVGAAHVAEGPTRTINLLALRWEQLTFGVAYLAHDISNAFAQLVTHKIPSEVRKGIAPVKVRLGRVETREHRDYRQLTGLRVYTRHQIERVIKPRITKVERQVNHDLPLRIHKGEIQRGKLETRVKHDEHTISRLLPLLTTVGAAGLVLRAFSRLGLNMLRCQNTKDALRELCASPPGSGKRLGRFLRDILGMTAGILFASQFCKIIVLVVDGAAPIANKLVGTLATAEAALCGGKYDAAPPLPLNVTALPPVTNPLSLG